MTAYAIKFWLVFVLLILGLSRVNAQENDSIFNQKQIELAKEAFKNGNFDKAIQLYAKHIQLLEHKTTSLSKSDSIELAFACKSLAAVYGEKALRRKALIYFEKAANIFDLVQKPEESVLVWIALAQAPWNSLEDQLKFLKSAIPIANNIVVNQAPMEHIAIVSKLNNLLTEVYLKLDKPDAARVFLDKNYQIYQKGKLIQNQEDYFFLTASWALTQKDYFLTEKAARAATNGYLRLYGPKSLSLSKAYELMARSFNIRGQTEKSLDYYRLAMEALSLSLEPTASGEMPTLIATEHQKQMLLLLLGYSETLKKINLLASFQWAQKALSFGTSIYQTSFENHPSEQLIRLLQEAFELNIGLAEKLFHQTDDIQFLLAGLKAMEANRFTLLNRTTRAAAMAPKFDSLHTFEWKLDQKLQLKEKELLELISKGESRSRSKIQLELESLVKLKAQFIADLEKEHPKYSQLKYKSFQTDLNKLRADLGPRDLLLEYFIGEGQVYVIAIGKESIQFVLLGESREIVAAINHLYGLLNKVDKSKSDIELLQVYAKPAFDFYQKWIKPAIAESAKRLIIVADGKLSYLPLEALLLETPKELSSFEKLPFLINKYQVHYRLAAALNGKEQKLLAKNKGQVLAFAPSYEPNSEEQKTKDVKAAKEQIDLLFQLFRGSFFSGNDALKETFNKWSASNFYSVIHLAAYGKGDTKQAAHSALFFSNQTSKEIDFELRVADIAQLELSANLVVMTAFEPGFASYARAEGLVALSQAFMLAGSSAVMPSLWPLSEDSVLPIMEIYYELLARRYAKDEALREAKLAYLRSAKGLAAHPYHWAANISLGDESPIELNKRTLVERYWFYGMLIVFIVLGIIIFVWRINRLAL